MEEQLQFLLKEFFGYNAFRPLQADIIKKVTTGEDVLALMPTGGGKSICFQLPALHLEGTAVVVSPLIALMKDQVGGLQANGIAAVALNSSLTEDERMEARRKCRMGEIKLLYISPEGVQAEISGLLSEMHISLIAVDEAHCISRWGHDFRPEYTQLSTLKERFPHVPIIALTATADKATRIDIIKQLRLQHPQIFVASFDRPNISLAVRRGLGKQEKISAMAKFILTGGEQSGIVYCTRRADTETVATALRAMGIKASAYHAGLAPQERDAVQEDFVNDRIEVVCATIAFGMGIDKSNVRFVIHYNMPSSIENYYQEIGRAGRDGLRSSAILFYSLGDFVTLRRFAEESRQSEINLEKLDRMQRFCETDLCRRRILLNYFGEETEYDCGNCDACLNPPERFDGSILVQKALSAILRTNERVGINLTIDILRASSRAELLQQGFHLLKTYGAGRDLSFKTWKEYIYQMLHLGYIEVDYAASHVLKVTPAGRKILFGKAPAMLTTYCETDDVRSPAKEKSAKKAKAALPDLPAIDDNSIEKTLLDELKKLRTSIARKEKMPPYIIFSDAALQDMALNKPATLEDFASIRGVGSIKLEKYGEAFMSLIREKTSEQQRDK
ncbi:MAG: DNA helicase RecQ [Tannerellaceae bacterium]|jgi:ATP-dependent DNA helicase RecQ|nr:DNA helicase RecQ [Tannerellaceae bacterium]